MATARDGYYENKMFLTLVDYTNAPLVNDNIRQAINTFMKKRKRNNLT